jgi:hypothetical protein
MRDHMKKSRRKASGGVATASRYNFSAENSQSRAQVGSGLMRRPQTSMRQQSIGEGTTTSAGRSTKEIPENSQLPDYLIKNIKEFKFLNDQSKPSLLSGHSKALI